MLSLRYVKDDVRREPASVDLSDTKVSSAHAICSGVFGLDGKAPVVSDHADPSEDTSLATKGFAPHNRVPVV